MRRGGWTRVELLQLTCPYVIVVCLYFHLQLTTFFTRVYNLHNISMIMRFNLIQFKMRIIGLLEIKFHTRCCSCDITNQQKQLRITSIMKWMSKIQINQKNVLIFKIKITIEAIIHVYNVDIQIQIQFSLLISFFFFILLLNL